MSRKKSCGNGSVAILDIQSILDEGRIYGRNIQFLLYEVFDSTALTKYPYFEDHGKETFDMVIETAMRMGKDLLYPCLSKMDKQPPEFKDGKVFAAPRSSDPGGEKLPLGDGLTVKMKQEWFE